MIYGRKVALIANDFVDFRTETFRITFGPQYSGGTRELKFQVGALAGFYFFRTNAFVSTREGFFPQEGDNERDSALGWNIGSGFQYDIGIGPWLDVALEYQTIYNVTSEVEIDNEAVKRDITANEFTLKVGVIFFLGK